MTTTRNITKQLITEEDMVLGIGTVDQIRNGVTKTLTKVSFAKQVPSIADLPPVVIGNTVRFNGYHPGSNVGGGTGVGKVARHNGVTNFDVARLPEFGTPDYYVNSGVDADCWVRVGVEVISSAMAGATAGGNNNAAVIKGISVANSIGVKFVYSGFEHVSDGVVQIDYDRQTIEFDDGAFITHTADTIAIQLGGGVTQRKGLFLNRPRIVTAGFGQDSAGLIQINNVKQWIVDTPIIESDRAAANARSRVYNGVATAVNSEDGWINNGEISGTPKSGVHVSTASRNITCYKVNVEDTGVHDTGTFGFSPAIDTGGYGGNHIVECHAKDTQGDSFLIAAENNATYGPQLCIGNSIVRSTGTNAGKSGIRLSSLTAGFVPTDIRIEDSVFDVCGQDGLEVGAGSGISSRNHFSNTQQAGIRATSDAENIYWKSVDDHVENFDLTDNANINGVLIGTVDEFEMIRTKFDHDFVGVTAGNIYAIGTVSGKTVSKLDIEKPDFNAVTQRWRVFAVPASGHYELVGSGIPAAGSQAPNGSRYYRTDGVSTNDNFYIRRGSAWVGIA